MTDLFFHPQPIEPSAAFGFGLETKSSVARQSVDSLGEPAPRQARPQPHPADESLACSTAGRSSRRGSVLGGSSRSAIDPEEMELEDRPSLLASRHSRSGSVLVSGFGSTSPRSAALLAGSGAARSGPGTSRGGREVRQHERKSRNYGSSARIGALLEHEKVMREQLGTSAGSRGLAASTSALSRPTLNSSMLKTQQQINAASGRLPQQEFERRVQEEMKRIEHEGREQAEQGLSDTAEASLYLEDSRVKERPGTDEIFRGLAPIVETAQVFKARTVRKQVDPKWQAHLALKPSMDDACTDEPAAQEVRSFSLPELPPLLSITPAPVLTASCGPMLVTSYTRHLDFECHDLRELPDGVLDVDRFCHPPTLPHAAWAR